MFSPQHPPVKKNQPEEIDLAGFPPDMEKCFQLLRAAGATYFALFGGAIRDADYAARHQQARPIKDYDLRVWLSTKEEDFEAVQNAFLSKLSDIAKTGINTEPCPGTNNVHYCFQYEGIELDVSIRAIPAIYQHQPHLSAVAIDRASSSDIGISSVAIDSSGQAWARPEYLQDQMNKTLTVYTRENVSRSKAYEDRMHAKFSDHHIVEPDFSRQAANLDTEKTTVLRPF